MAGDLTRIHAILRRAFNAVSKEGIQKYFKAFQSISKDFKGFLRDFRGSQVSFMGLQGTSKAVQSDSMHFRTFQKVSCGYQSLLGDP